MKKFLFVLGLVSLVVISGCNIGPVEVSTTDDDKTNQEDTQEKDNKKETRNKKDVTIGDDEERMGDIEVIYGDVSIGEDFDLLGGIIVEEGDVEIEDGVEISEGIEVDKGNITIANDGQVNGDIIAHDGDIMIGDENQVWGDVISDKGTVELGDENQIKGDIEAVELIEGDDNEILGDFTELEMKVGDDDDDDDDDAEMVYMEGGEKVNKECLDYYNEIVEKYGSEYDDCYGEIAYNSCDDIKANAVMVIDASGSMMRMVGNETMMEIAKDSANDFVGSVTSGTKLGLVVYGHKGGNTGANKADSCKAVETLYSLATPNESTLKSEINSIKAVGWTPIAEALEEAKDVLEDAPSDEQRWVLLISDGEETCDGNPTSVASQLNKMGIQVHTVGFNVGGAAEKQLKKIADNGGGRYYPARTAQELNTVLISFAAQCINENAEVWGEMLEEAALKVGVCSERLAKETALMTEEAMEDVPMECKGVVGGWIGERGAQIGAQINDAGDRVHDAAENIADDIVSDVDDMVGDVGDMIPDIPDVEIPDNNF